MKKIIVTLLSVLAFIQSCAPSLQYTSMDNSKESKPANHNIVVYNSNHTLSSNAKIIGSLYIGDTGLSVGCGYDDVIILAKEKARKVGGDAIQITEINYPNFISSCYRIKANIIAYEKVETPEEWKTITRSELEYKKYFDENNNNLDPIEGIWTMSENIMWVNVLSGIKGNNDASNVYRIAIIKNKNSDDSFSGYILESRRTEWKPGLIKVKYRKTAYQMAYEQIWYKQNYSEQISNVRIKNKGMIRETRSWAEYPLNYEMETILLKVYPTILSSSIKSFTSRNKSTGSGFIISEKGLIVTNYHVVENSNNIEVLFPQNNLIKTAHIKIKDKKNDIAILQIDDFSFNKIFNQTIPYTITDATLTKVGEEVFTLGFPLGDIMGTKSRLATGRINSFFGLQDDPRLFQISNPLQPGNSGGPLFNSKGELVGLVVSSLNAKFFYENIGVIPQNVNFAIKSTYLLNLISMIPESDEILKRNNSVKQGKMEEQIEQLNQFVVQIKVN